MTQGTHGKQALRLIRGTGPPEQHESIIAGLLVWTLLISIFWFAIGVLVGWWLA